MSARLPLVSVVMPVRDERAAIARTLDGVLAQDYPRELLEVLVADGRSEDGTREVLAAYAARDPRIRVLDNPRRWAASGLNLAIAAARGEVIVRVDGHVELPTDYVRACVEELLASGADNVGGAITSVGQGTFGRAVALAMSSRFGTGGARFRTGRGHGEVDTVQFGCWRRELFERIGGFDEELVRNQDDEHNSRLRSRGGRVLLSPRIRSRYTVRATPRALWRQYFGYGLWKVRVLQLHPGQLQPRQLAPPLLVGALVAGGALAAALPPLALSWLLAAGAYGLAVGAAAVWVAVRAGEPGLAPALALAFATLHLAYGAGFWVGLLRFAPRWALSARAAARAAAPPLR